MEASGKTEAMQERDGMKCSTMSGWADITELGMKAWVGGGGGVGFFFFFKQKTAYEIVSRDWSSDVCSSDLVFILPFSRCGSAPLFILPRFSLRQRPRFFY